MVSIENKVLLVLQSHLQWRFPDVVSRLMLQ